MGIARVLSYLIAIVGTGISAYFDTKTTFIPDWLTHSMIILGAILLFFQYDITTSLYYIAISAIVFILGFIVYTLGQLGGGDVKLYTALTLLVPEFHSFYHFITPPYPPIVSIFFASSLIGVFFISLSQIYKIWRDRMRISEFWKKLSVGIIGAVLILAVSLFLVFISPGAVLLFIPVSLGLLVFPFKDDIIKLYVLEKKPVSKLTEDDIIAIDEIPEDKRKELGIGIRKTYLNAELKVLKEKAEKVGIDYVYVYENLPTFGIYIFLGLLFVLLFGDPIFAVLSL